MITFTCDLDIPRTDTITYIPTSWSQDTSISYEAAGFLLVLLMRARPGVIVGEAELPQHEDDSPLAEMMAELVAAGYLVRELGDRYRLVHPDRLPPLPHVETETT
jgi:hypothetical protein